jgi:hypothetical protein
LEILVCAFRTVNFGSGVIFVFSQARRFHPMSDLDELWYWTQLGPDDSPLVMRDASTQEIYAQDVDFP